MNTKIVDQNVKISYTIVTHFRASKLRLKPDLYLDTIPKHANFNLIQILMLQKKITYKCSNFFFKYTHFRAGRID